ncbi:MAG: hypothetical protein AVDCRST_MAG80-271, partial [uncultured Rubrobacteraceae bacterium]
GHEAAQAVDRTARRPGHAHHGRGPQGRAASRDREDHRNRASTQVGTPGV